MPDEREPSPEEINKRVRDLLGNDKEDDEVDPIERRLAELEERTRQVRANNPFPDPPELKYKRSANVTPKFEGGNYYRGLGIGLAILYAFVGPIIVGVGIGWFLSKRNGAGDALLWGTTIGVVCGFVGGLVMVVQSTRTGPKE